MTKPANQPRFEDGFASALYVMNGALYPSDCQCEIWTCFHVSTSFTLLFRNPLNPFIYRRHSQTPKNTAHLCTSN